jgi:hypothetical protein
VLHAPVAALTVPVSIPKNSKYRIVRDSNGEFHPQFRFAVLFWFDIWVKPFASFDDALTALEKDIENTNKTGTVLYLDEDGKPTL